MQSIDQKNNKLFFYWLNISFLMVFFMIIVGGLTRLTDSGLSITEWELFTGILPPLTNKQWIEYFSLYKRIPQYQLLNTDMTLDEFKIIFYWEYFHRILGRIIGLFFLIPLVYFHFTQSISKKKLINCYLILSLIIIQGIVGWFMVQSGLVNDITVSHYRLSLHLSIAFLIILTMFWLIKNEKLNTTKKFFTKQKGNNLYLILILILFFQISLGAFVSGLDAGKIYQTWPLMGQTFIPNDLETINFGNFFDFNNRSLVQFYHRNTAYLITFYIIFIGFIIFKDKINSLKKPYYLLLFFLFLQILLGIITLTSGLNMYLASSHQICSLLLMISAINLYYYHIN